MRYLNFIGSEMVGRIILQNKVKKAILIWSVLFFSGFIR